jgi:hypothetical protein
MFGSSGSGTRVAEDFLEIDGVENKIVASKQILITPDTGQTGINTSGQGGGAGIIAQGGPTGNGMRGTGGATSGDGVQGIGGAVGDGVQGTGGTTSGAGGRFIATAGNSDGMIATGIGSGEGVTGQGGATGHGVLGTGGASGSGVQGFGGQFGHGVEGVGGSSGHGVVAQSDLTSPIKTALRIVPQDAEASTPVRGDVQVLTDGKMRVHNGANFDRVVSQAFSAVSASDDLSATVETDFAQSYTIPSSSVIAGTTIRVKVACEVVADSGGGASSTTRLKIGTVTFATITLGGVNVGEAIFFDMYITMRTATTGHAVITTWNPETAPITGIVMTAGAFTFAGGEEIKVTNIFDAINNTMRLEQLIVDIQ